MSPLNLSGSTGISGVDGSSGTPAIQGTDTNTGISFPAADTVAVNTGGSERVRCDSSGRVGIGTTSPGEKLEINGVTGLRANSGGYVAKFLNSASTSELTGFIYDNNQDNLEITAYDSSYALAFKTNNTERMRLDTSGRLLVGTSTSRGNLFNTTGQDMRLQIEGTDYLTSGVSFTSNSNSQSNCPHIAINRTRGTTIGSNTVVQDSDLLGIITFGGNDGSEFVEAARITAIVDATPGANDMPGRLVFSTTADGASSPTQRFAIYRDGNVVPIVDNAYRFGGTFFRWSEIYAANGTIQTSDLRTKTEVATSALGADFIKSLRPVSYRWIEGGKRETLERDDNGEAIFESIPGARTHWGFIAQEVKEAVDAAGVDFGGWLLSDKDDPDSQQALRYDQFIAPLTKALQEALDEIDVLKAKVAALESA